MGRRGRAQALGTCADKRAHARVQPSITETTCTAGAMSRSCARLPVLFPQVKELLKKMFLTGALIAILPDTPEQIIIGFLFAIADLVSLAMFSPYPTGFVVLVGWLCRRLLRRRRRCC